MRILVANKFWYRRGGLERVMLDEVSWLEDAGHKVACFSTAHPENEASPWSDYFVPYLELGGGRQQSLGEKARASIRLFSNRDAARRIGRLIDEFRPDVMHAHGVHRQLSPAILTAASRRGVPIVQTLHDFHQICPSDTLLRGGTTPCVPRACGTYWFGAAVSNRCVRASRGVSALSAAETSFQRIRRVYERTVDRFIAPSAFTAETMAQAGLSESSLVVVPNAVRSGPAAEPGTGFVFIGRLAAEKGVLQAVDAARDIGVSLRIAGEGPLGEKLQGDSTIELLGRLDGDEVEDLLRSARAVLVPSLALENAPMAVLEPMAIGIPVIASDVGGIPEIVEDGENGLLVPPGDARALADAMSRLASDGELAARMGRRAREKVLEEYTPEKHVDALLGVYEAVGSARAGAR